MEDAQENAAAIPYSRLLYQTKLAGAAKTCASKTTRARKQTDGQAKKSGIAVAAGGDVSGNDVSGALGINDAHMHSSGDEEPLFREESGC